MSSVIIEQAITHKALIKKRITEDELLILSEKDEIALNIHMDRLAQLKKIQKQIEAEQVAQPRPWVESEKFKAMYRSLFDWKKANETETEEFCRSCLRNSDGYECDECLTCYCGNCFVNFWSIPEYLNGYSRYESLITIDDIDYPGCCVKCLPILAEYVSLEPEVALVILSNVSGTFESNKTRSLLSSAFHNNSARKIQKFMRTSARRIWASNKIKQFIRSNMLKPNSRYVCEVLAKRFQANCLK